jgi:hypothetical protein
MKKALGVALATLFLSAQAGAESQHGVQVYPGAKADAQVAADLKKSMKITAHTYRTTDSVEKVAQFYKSQKLKEMPGADKKQAGFMADGVHVTVQNPWMDMQSGKINNDTLISIVKQK